MISISIYKGKSTRLRSGYILLKQERMSSTWFMEDGLIFMVRVDGV